MEIGTSLGIESTKPVVVRYTTQYTGDVDNAIGTHVLPVGFNLLRGRLIPEKVSLTELGNSYEDKGFSGYFSDSLSFSIDGGASVILLSLPVIISVSGGNEIIRRTIAKAKDFQGTVKERWTKKDKEIKISGVIIGDESGVYPKDEVKDLLSVCEHTNDVLVYSKVLKYLGITNIAILDWELTHTDGMENQEFSIRAVSDYQVKLFL